MPRDEKSQSPSPPPTYSRSSSREKNSTPITSIKARSRSRSPHFRSSGSFSRRKDPTPTKARSRSQSREYSRMRARSWSPRRGRSFSPRRRNSETIRDSGQAGKEYDDRRLHVANLDVDTSQRDMEQVFGRFGPLKEIWLARSIPAFAFVIYRDRADTLEALRKADRREICGRTIRVTIAHKSYPFERKGIGNERIRKCFHCGDSRHISRDCYHGPGHKRFPSYKGRGGGRGRYHPRGFQDDRRYDSRK